MSWLALVMAASITGGVHEQRPCPPACDTTISVSMQASGTDRSVPGRYFVGVFPVENGQPNVAVGGYWDGRTWQISQIPTSFRRGSLAGVQDRIRVAGGLCAFAAAQGAPAGTYAVIAGFGPDVLGDRFGELAEIARDADAESAAKLNAMMEQVRQAGGEQRMSDFAAAKAMREQGTYRELGRVRCG